MMTKKFFFWLGLLTVSFLVMVQPAHAALEQVAPITGGWFYNPYGTGSPSANKTTVLEACTSANNFTTGTTIYDHIVLLPGWETAAHGTNVAECWGKRVSDGVIVWARWITKVFVTPTCPVPTVHSEVPYVYNSATNKCERTITDCPTMSGGSPAYSGYEFVSVPSGVNPNLPMNDVCDANNCAVNVNVVGSIFGVALVRKIPTDYSCPGSPAPPSIPVTLTVTFTSADAPPKVDYDAVVAAAAAVDASRVPVEIARVSAAEYELNQSGFTVMASVKTATDAVAAEEVAASDTVSAAINYTRDPTPASLDIYNAFKAEFAAKSASANDAITQAKSDYKQAQATAADAPLLTSGAEKVKQAAEDLNAAITKSGQPYDAAQVAAAIGDTAALDAAIAAAAAELAALNAKIAATTAAFSDLLAQMAKLTASVQAAIDRLNGLGVPPEGPPLPPPPPPPAPPPVDCSLTPNAPGCYVPPPVDCTLTPSAPGCALPVDCVLTPNAPGCQSMSGTPTVGTLAISGVYVAGTLNEGKTFANVFDNFKSRASAAPVVSAATNFFNVSVAAGNCPAWSTEVPMFGTFVFDFYCRPFFQDLLPWMRGVILLIFGVVAFRIAVL